MFTLSHELTHFIKEWSPEKFKVFGDFLIEQYGEHGFDVETLIRRKMVEYKTDNTDLAYEELVADACEAMLIDSNAAEKLMMLNQKDSGLVAKIKEFIKNFFNKVKAMYQRLSPDSTEARAVREMHDVAEKLYQLFEDMAVDAAQNKRSAGQTKNTAGNSGVKSQLREDFAQQVDDWKNGLGKKYGNYNGEFFELGTTPNVFVKHGAKSVPLIMYDDCIIKVTGGKHQISLDELKKLPQELNDPVLLFKGSVGNSFVALTEMKMKNGHNAVVAIHINKYHNRYCVNKIASIHSRTNDYGKDMTESYVKNNIASGNLLDASIKKAPIWFTSRGLQLPKLVQTIIDANNNVPQNNTVVNSHSMQNSKKNSQNVKSSLRKDLETINKDYLDAVKNNDTKLAQQMVDNAAKIAGYSRPMYRGDNTKFTVFDRKKSKASNLYGRGFYFTDSESHANTYGTAQKYYLKINNPLSDTSIKSSFSKAELRAYVEAIAENEDYGIENYGYDATVDSIVNSLYKKPDYQVINDINATCIGDFVAAIELFNEINGTSFDGIELSTETVVFDSSQIKSADPITYDDNGDVIPLSKRFDSKEKDIRYSKRKEYWKPDLTSKEWEILNKRLSIEIHYSDNDIDSNTKWMYNDRNGTQVFAIYGIGDGTEPTVLYAVGGKKAIKQYAIFMEMLKGENNNASGIQTDRSAKSFSRRIKAILAEQQSRQTDNRVHVGRGTSSDSNAEVYARKSERDARENHGRSETLGEIKNSLRRPSYRDIIASIDESQIDTSTQQGKNEVKTLKKYMGILNSLEEQQQILNDVNGELHKIYKIKKGQKRDTSHVPELRIKKMQALNRLAICENQLARLEKSVPIIRLLEQNEKYLNKQNNQEDVLKKSADRKVESIYSRLAKEKLQKTVLSTVKWLTKPTKADVKCPDALKKPLGELLGVIDLSSKQKLKGGESTKNDR